MELIKFVHAEFSELTSSQLTAVFRLRQNVFIIEQQCFYEDIDGSDQFASHLLAQSNGELAGYLRIFKPGIKYENAASIGRIVVQNNYRGTKIGKLLISKGIDIAKTNYPYSRIKIEAQAALKNYYSEFGFTTISNVYEVDEIPHILMEMKA